MRKLIGLTGVVVAVVAVAFAVSAAAASKTVRWHTGSKTTFSIHKGGTVKWVWTDGKVHDVHGPGFSSKFSSRKGFAYTHRFTKRGTFKIICEVHPTTMKTVVKVG